MKEKHSIEIKQAACIGCGLCEKDCPMHNIAVVEKKAMVKAQSCIMCGHCVAICPKEAVSMTGFSKGAAPFEQQTRLNADELLKALETRRSIRQFKDQAVPKEILAKIIEAGRLTPTAKNTQAVSYFVLQENIAAYEKMACDLFRTIMPIAKAAVPSVKSITIDDNFFFKKAPVAILVAADQVIDGGLAASNMALMAEACGLGVLYSGFTAMAVNRCKKLQKALGVEAGKAVTALVLGYPDVTYYRTAPKEDAQVRYL